MYKHLISLIFYSLIALSPCASITDTDAGPYLGMQYVTGDITLDDQPESFSPTTLIVRAGQPFRDHYSLEGRMAVPLSDDSKTISGASTTVGLFSMLGVYGTARATLKKRYSVYAIAGLSLVSNEVAVSNVDRSDTITGISYGAGMDIGSGGTKFNLEYISYLDESSFDYDAFAFGVAFVF